MEGTEGKEWNGLTIKRRVLYPLLPLILPLIRLYQILLFFDRLQKYH